MDDLARLVAERACERLMTTYATLVDAGTAGQVPELFTDDGVFETVGRGRAEGRAALQRGFDARQAQDRRSRHVITNMLVDVTSPDEATGSCTLVLFNADGLADDEVGPMEGARAVGRYLDTYRRTSDGWRIATRTLDMTFVRRSDE